MESRRSKEASFPRELLRLMMDVPDVARMEFQEGLATIFIPSPKALEARLPDYFNHSCYTSFQRQLNNFGFNKHEIFDSSVVLYRQVKGPAVYDFGDFLRLRPLTPQRKKRAKSQTEKRKTPALQTNQSAAKEKQTFFGAMMENRNEAPKDMNDEAPLRPLKSSRIVAPPPSLHFSPCFTTVAKHPGPVGGPEKNNNKISYLGAHTFCITLERSASDFLKDKEKNKTEKNKPTTTTTTTTTTNDNDKDDKDDKDDDLSTALHLDDHLENDDFIEENDFNAYDSSKTTAHHQGAPSMSSTNRRIFFLEDRFFLSTTHF